MRALRLDFQDRGVRLPLAGTILLAAALSGLGATGYQYFRLSAQVDEWRASLAQFERNDRHRAQLTKAEQKQLESEIDGARKVTRALSLPWDDLFGAVESTLNSDVTLLGIEPDAQKNEVKISAEARNFVAMLEYVKRLQASPVFGEVLLVNHRIDAADPDKPVRFSMIAAWRTRP